jgi:hypothetical protein
MIVTWASGSAVPSGRDRLPRASHPSPPTPPAAQGQPPVADEAVRGVQHRLGDGLALVHGRTADDEGDHPAIAGRGPDVVEVAVEIAVGCRVHPRSVADPASIVRGP